MGDIYNHAAMSQVGRPTRYSHAEQRVFADGIQGGTNGTTLPLPQGSVGLNGPRMNGRYVTGNTHADSANDGIVQETNSRGVHHMAQNMLDWQKGDTHQDCVLFVQHAASAVRPDMRLTTYRMLCLTELNRRLHHDTAFRRKWGKYKHAVALRTEWALRGILHTKDTDIDQQGESAVSSREVMMVIDGRCTMPNIALERTPGIGVKHSVNELDCIYLIWTRHEYTGDAAVMDWDCMPPPAPVSRGLLLHKKRVREAELADARENRNPNARETPEQSAERCFKDNAVLRATLLDVARLSDRSVVRSVTDTAMDGTDPVAGTIAFKPSATRADDPAPEPAIHPLEEKRTLGAKGVKEYYWRISTYVAHDRSPPSSRLWCAPDDCDPHNRFTGDYQLLGQVMHRTRGPNHRTMTQVELARAAMYTEKRGGGYLDSMAKLDRMELFVGHGSTGF